MDRTVDFHQLPRFVNYADKRFDLPLLASGLTDRRRFPQIPSRAVGLSLLLGEVVQVGAFLPLQKQTYLPQWQRLVGHQAAISHDVFGYVSERMEPERLRRGLRWINRKLKRGKVLEANKLKGLLVASLDANEQFNSYSRCCEACLTREVTSKDAQGQAVTRTQYYHKQVYLQLCGPELSVVLDLEPMRPGEEEGAAGLRLLRRAHQQYGPRFFDVVVVDSWYAKGPFFRAVVKELGWPVIAVLKQERYGIYQETLALTQGPPTHQVERDGRQVDLWDLKAMDFSESYPDPVRGVRVKERYPQRKQIGGKYVKQDQSQHWIWVVVGDLDQFDGAVIRDAGHWRWKVENNAFNELTQHWQLTHCAHHHPVAIEALLLLKLIAFTLFHAFALGFGKRFRMGPDATLNDQREEIYQSLLCGPALAFWSG